MTAWRRNNVVLLLTIYLWERDLLGITGENNAPAHSLLHQMCETAWKRESVQ